MRIQPRIAINLVGVAALFVLTVGWVVVRLVAPALIDRPFAVTADFASSGGVFTNQEVTYRGVLIGKVGAMDLTEDGVTIELLIDPDWANEIPANVDASVQSKSAVGEQFVNLVPNGISVSETLDDGDEIPRSRTELPVDFQKLLRTLDNVLADIPPQRTRELVQNLSDALGGRSDDIATILESLATLSDAFASVAPEQQRLLDNATETGTAFLKSKDEFSAAIKAADEVLAGLGDEPGELRRLFVQNDRVARAGLRLIARNGDDLHAGIDALGDFVDFQLEEQDAILDSFTYVPQFLHAIEDASVPWRDADGDEYYRIRVGLILDNVESSWPCKYKLPFEYHRLPHERDPRLPETIPDLECTNSSSSTSTASSDGSNDDSLIEALRVLIAEEKARQDNKVKGNDDIDWGDVWPDAPPQPEDSPEPEPDPDPSTEPSSEPSPSPSPT